MVMGQYLFLLLSMTCTQGPSKKYVCSQLGLFGLPTHTLYYVGKMVICRVYAFGEPRPSPSEQTYLMDAPLRH